MMAPDSNNEVPLDGFDVHGASNYIIQSTLSTAPNQALQLVSQGSHSSGSANVDGINSVGILSGSDSRAGRTSSSNLKSSKKKKCYYHRRSGEKKERLIWTPELHQSFLEYYNRSPNEKRVPKKILEEMRKTFPYITRENVASHLQKHRLYLKNSKNIKEMGNSAKSSSKSVPRKVTIEESNFHQFYNNSTVSTAQFPHQSHSSISTSPNSSQLPLQSHTLVHDQTLLNQVLSQFDETHLSDENMVHSLDIDRNNIPIHGGANIYSNMMNNVLESQRNPFGVIGQSSNAANNSDFPVRVNHLFPPPIIPTNNHDQLISNIDGNGNGFQDPIMGNSFGVLTGNDYSLAALPNFLYYNMNLNLDHLQVDGMNNMYSLGSYSDSLQFDYPLNLNVANELQPQDFEQALRSILYQPGNHLVDDASTWPQIFRKSMGRRL